jgi:type II secretory pathway component PulF
MLFLKRIRLYRALANACQSGYPAPRALRTFAAREGDERLAAMAAGIEAGKSFSDSMRGLPDLFPSWQVEVVAVGETSGRLDKSFGIIAESLEAARSFWLKLLPKLAYPLLILHFAPFAFHVSLVFSSGWTVYLLKVAWSLAPLYAAGAGVWWLASWVKARPGLLPYVPLAGGFIRGRFAHYLALLVEAGVSFSKALTLASRAAGLPEDHPGLRAALDRCAAGGSVLEGLRDLGLFRPEELDAIDVGEATGKLDRELDHLASAVRERNEAALATILYLAPALAILIVGLLLARRLMAFYDARLDINKYIY